MAVVRLIGLLLLEVLRAAVSSEAIERPRIYDSRKRLSSFSGALAAAAQADEPGHGPWLTDYIFATAETWRHQFHLRGVHARGKILSQGIGDYANRDALEFCAPGR